MRSERESFVRLRILVVESHRAIRELLTEFLSDLGHEVTSEANPRNELALLEHGQFDLMLVADSLFQVNRLGGTEPSLSSEGNGLDLARTARENDPSLKIILLSGFGRAGLTAGDSNRIVDMTIGKPFILMDVEDALEALFATSELCGNWR